MAPQRLRFTAHAVDRMDRYGIHEVQVIQAVEEPDEIVRAHGDRLVFQRAADGKVLRVVVEEYEGIRIVIMVYKARRARYERNL